MRRSGRSNNGTVPAFFTRSRAKNFFGGNSAERPNQNVQQRNEDAVEIRVEESELKTEVKKEIRSPEKNTAQQQETNQISAIDVGGISEHNQNPQGEVIDLEMKEEGARVPLTKTENSGSEDDGRKNVSATTKALAQMQQVTEMKKNFKKKQKLPLCIRRRKLNQRLNRILTPKSGVIFLHELKPGCTFKIQEQPGSNPLVFVAQVEYNDRVLAVGQGMTKPSAKNAAAENAIKVLVAEALTQQAGKRESTEGDDPRQCDSPTEDEAMDTTTDDLSLAGLASFAMYKMFTEWQSQGTDFPLLSFQQKKKPSGTVKPPPVKKELPPNADKLHPSFLLNTMRPGILSTELERTAKDNVSFVTMGYEVDGKMYTGSGSNKKEARKRAAQAALTALYGLKYEE